jgi:hypothetical protein
VLMRYLTVTHNAVRSGDWCRGGTIKHVDIALLLVRLWEVPGRGGMICRLDATIVLKLARLLGVLFRILSQASNRVERFCEIQGLLRWTLAAKEAGDLDLPCRLMPGYRFWPRAGLAAWTSTRLECIGRGVRLKFMRLNIETHGHFVHLGHIWGY